MALMSHLETNSRVRFFETASLLVIALTAVWFIGLLAYAEARHRGLLEASAFTPSKGARSR
jgi:hypothetical protein